jgi:hypothetical protein
MVLARFRDLCLDASNAATLGAFWAAVLDRRWEPDGTDDGVLRGPTPQHTVWLNPVPEPKTVKHRAHFDIYARSLDDLIALGATVVRPQGDDRGWTVLADPEGGEFCAFLRDELPAERMHGLVVDSIDPLAQASWWASVFGADLIDDPRGFATVENVPDLPILTMDFVPVPEPKTVKNRIHWDVNTDDLQPLFDAGATLIRARDDEIRWNVLADPEGNEFCAFVES